MASQLRRVTGNTAVSPSSLAHARLQAKIAGLPEVLAARQQRKNIARDTRFQNRQLALQKAAAKQRQREQQAAMGLDAAKLGLSVGMSDFGKKTIGDAFTAGKGVVNKIPGVNVNPKVSGLPSSVSNFNIGGALASGLTGYGVGNLIGGKNKLKKGLYGAGSGALMGLLTAPKGGGLGGLLSGALFGGAGGFFG